MERGEHAVIGCCGPPECLVAGEVHRRLRDRRAQQTARAGRPRVSHHRRATCPGWPTTWRTSWTHGSHDMPLLARSPRGCSPSCSSTASRWASTSRSLTIAVLAIVDVVQPAPSPRGSDRLVARRGGRHRIARTGAPHGPDRHRARSHASCSVAWRAGACRSAASPSPAARLRRVIGLATETVGAAAIGAALVASRAGADGAFARGGAALGRTAPLLRGLVDRPAGRGRLHPALRVGRRGLRARARGGLPTADRARGSHPARRVRRRRRVARRGAGRDRRRRVPARPRGDRSIRARDRAPIGSTSSGSEAPIASPGRDRGHDRARGRRPAVRRLRRRAGRVPLRRGGHAVGDRHDVQRLRATGLLPARCRRRAGRAAPRRRASRHATHASVPGRRRLPARPDRRDPRVRGPAAAPLPGGLRLDRAPVLRRGLDPLACGRRRHRGCAAVARPDALDRARAWRRAPSRSRSGSPRSGRTPS